MPLGKVGNDGTIARIDALHREACGIAELDLERGRSIEVVVGQHHLLAPIEPGGHTGDGLADSTDPNLQDAHAGRRYSTLKAVRMPSW